MCKYETYSMTFREFYCEWILEVFIDMNIWIQERRCDRKLKKTT